MTYTYPIAHQKTFPIAPNTIALSDSGELLNFRRGFGVLEKRCTVITSCPLDTKWKAHYTLDDRTVSDVAKQLRIN